MGTTLSKSEGEISTTESISDVSSTSIKSDDFKDSTSRDPNSTTTPTGQVLSQIPPQQQQISQEAAILNVETAATLQTPASATCMDSNHTPQIENATVSTEVLDIKQMLSQFNDRLNKKIEDSQEHFNKKIEDSQQQFRVCVVKDIKDAIADDVLKPLQHSLEQANAKIANIETDHLAKISQNASEIEKSKIEFESKINDIRQKMDTLRTQTSTKGSVTHAHAINPAILGRQNNVIIAGLTEESAEDINEEVKKLASTIEVEITSIKARRLGKSTPNKARPVLVEFTSHWEKRKFYSAKTKLKEKNKESIFFNEDLDKQSAKLYYLGRAAKKENLIKSIWTYGCQVFFSHKGQSTPILLTSEDQLPAAPQRSTVSQSLTANDGNASSNSVQSTAAPPSTPTVNNSAGANASASPSE